MGIAKLKDRLRYTWLHPRYLVARYLGRALSKTRPFASGLLLDIGCGRKPYMALFADRVSAHIGVDMRTTMHGAEAIDAFATALALPVTDGAVDTVLATEVIEHVPDPRTMIGEIARVLRPSGYAIITAPLHEPLHELPFDYYRYTHLGLAHLLNEGGLDVVRVERRGGALAVYGYLLSSYLYRHHGSTGYPARMTPRPLVAPFVVALCAVVQVVSALLDSLSRDDFDTQGFVVVAQRQAPAGN